MPDLVGMQYGKAKVVVENAGLVFAETMFAESYEARNTVLDQAPARGQMVYAGDRVAVAISRDSYARWLPAIYQRSDLAGRNLVKELLWVTQHLFGSVEEMLDIGFTYYDPYEAPEKFLSWLASWTAMVLEEDWPTSKKRRLIKRAVELYRIRGTLRGLKLFISLFTGHEPDIRENEWPFRGWRVGISSQMGIDTVILPPLNLARTFIVEMPTAYNDLSPESVVRIHEIVRMEKPAHTQYWLRFAAESNAPELREFFAIGTRSGIGIGQEILRAALGGEATTAEAAADARTTAMMAAQSGGEFPTNTRIRRPLPKAARADLAPIEGREVRSSEEGFGASARQMSAVVAPVDATAPRTAQSDAAPVPESNVVQPMPEEANDTEEHPVRGRTSETKISSTSKKLADEMKRERDKNDDESRDPPTSVRGKKPDPKKTK
jgi:phage tail-like protein